MDLMNPPPFDDLSSIPASSQHGGGLQGRERSSSSHPCVSPGLFPGMLPAAGSAPAALPYHSMDLNADKKTKKSALGPSLLLFQILHLPWQFQRFGICRVTTGKFQICGANCKMHDKKGACCSGILNLFYNYLLISLSLLLSRDGCAGVGAWSCILFSPAFPKQARLDVPISTSEAPVTNW